ncbi:MAG TPA: hypothetical protein VD886_03250 [Herpetosiphonaceae bacterium]|nr:hypothetical protein [Herpetosiphonaceae bacterium]
MQHRRWFIAAHARAWQLARMWRPYVLAAASCLGILAAHGLAPQPLALVLGTELTAGVMIGFLTNSIRTPWTSVAPRDLLLLRVPRPAKKAQDEPVGLQRLVSGESLQG